LPNSFTMHRALRRRRRSLAFSALWVLVTLTACRSEVIVGRKAPTPVRGQPDPADAGVERDARVEQNEPDDREVAEDSGSNQSNDDVMDVDDDSMQMED
jgi:hypothetical protein